MLIRSPRIPRRAPVCCPPPMLPVCINSWSVEYWYYWGSDEKIGKKDQQDDLGSEVARKALWKINWAWETSESRMMVWEESYSTSLYRSLNLTIYCTSHYGGHRANIPNCFVQQLGFMVFRNLIAFHPLSNRLLEYPLIPCFATGSFSIFSSLP